MTPEKERGRSIAQCDFKYSSIVFENTCIIAEYMADNLRLNTWESYMKEAILMKESNRVFIL